MSEKLCVQCGKSISGSRWKYCSEECYQVANKEKYNLANPFQGTTSATTGAISELRVAVDLMSRGYNVFRAMSPSCPCDLTVFKDDKLLRIEVRTGHMSISGKTYNFKKERDKADVWAIVFPDKIIYEPSLE